MAVHGCPGAALQPGRDPKHHHNTREALLEKVNIHHPACEGRFATRVGGGPRVPV
jgi:hypothetical protein